MQLSRKCEYAFLALIELAKDKQLKSIQQIAEAWDIPKKFLEQIMTILKNAGLIQSVKGAHGGYRLKKNPEEITIAQIIRLIDGPIAPVRCVSKYFYEPTPIERHEGFYLLMIETRDMILDKLEKTTIKDVLHMKK